MKNLEIQIAFSLCFDYYKEERNVLVGLSRSNQSRVSQERNSVKNQKKKNEQYISQLYRILESNK